MSGAYSFWNIHGSTARGTGGLGVLWRRPAVTRCAAWGGGPTKVLLSTKDGTLAFICVTDAGAGSLFQGVPAVARAPLGRPAGTMPAILLEQTGPPVQLIPHALQVGTNLTRDELRKCTVLCGITTRGMKKVMTRLDYVTLLARHLFDEAVAKQVIAFYSCPGGRGGHDGRSQDADMADITDVLLTYTDQDNLGFFQDLKDKALDKLKATFLRAPEEQPRCPREYCTPEHVKNRMPGGGTLPGVYIVENMTRRLYNAYYKDARPFESCSRSWGGRTGRSQEQALDIVLAWQHRQHALAQQAKQETPAKQDDVEEPPKRRKIMTKSPDIAFSAIRRPSERPPTKIPNVRLMGSTYTAKSWTHVTIRRQVRQQHGGALTCRPSQHGGAFACRPW